MDFSRRIVAGPISHSLHYEPKTKRIVRIYGDNHEVVGNPGEPDIEDELITILNNEPKTRVFGEFSKGEPEKAYENKHLVGLQQKYRTNVGGFRTNGRLVNTNSIRDKILQDFDDAIFEAKKDEVDEVDEEEIHVAKAQFLDDLKKAYADGVKPYLIGEEGKTKREKKKEINEQIEAFLEDIDEEEDKISTMLLANPLVEYEALKHLQKQPKNTEFIFYIGDGHKDELDRILPHVRDGSKRVF